MWKDLVHRSIVPSQVQGLLSWSLLKCAFLTDSSNLPCSSTHPFAKRGLTCCAHFSPALEYNAWHSGTYEQMRAGLNTQLTLEQYEGWDTEPLHSSKFVYNF